MVSAKVSTTDDPSDPTKGLRKQRSDVVEAVIPSLQVRDMWALGITIVIGGQYFAWNAALVAGFGSFIIATLLISIGYLCLSLCIAELSSGLPFAGGSYGLARVTAGIFPGYLVACFDSIESVIYVATSTVSIGQMMTEILHTPVAMEPLYWFLFYSTAMAINAYGGLFFWRINMGLAVISTVIVLLYVFGAASFADFEENAPIEGESGNDRWFVGGFSEFMKVLPIPCWFYVGVESINLACQDTAEPKKLIPKGYVATIATLITTCIGVLFVAVSLSPGIEDTSEQLAIFNNGWRKMFGCSERVAYIFSLPALYATAFGFMFCYGRQLRSMGNSGLLNTEIGKSIEGRNTPGRALLLGSVIGLAVCLIVYFVPYIGLQLYNICMLGAFNAYFAQFYSYYVFNTKLSSIKREFRSPLGLAGAAVGTLVFFLAMIGIIGFQGDDGFAIIVFTVYVIGVSVYYMLVVIHRQYFSKEESEVLLIAHVMTNNMKRGQKASPFVKFLKKYGLVPKKKSKTATGNTGGANSNQTGRTARSSVNSVVASTYSIGGDQDVEAALAKKDKTGQHKAKNAEHNERKEEAAKAAAKSGTVPIPEGPEFEITGDTRSLKHAGDPDADVVVPYEAIEGVMQEADEEHATLKNVIELVARVSSKGASGRYDAPHHADLWSPRQEGIPEQLSEGNGTKAFAFTEEHTQGNDADAVEGFVERFSQKKDSDV